ncbi:MAG: Hsp20/alpha crystallin family protein [Clostridia bacterium]|nr:Hsp20/alpha crystallin family protein [Clostridia bacterium]
MTPYKACSSFLHDPFVELMALEKQLLDKKSLIFQWDIRKKDNAYVIEADLPGVKKEDVTLSVEEDVLTVSAKRERATAEEEENGYVRGERAFGSFSRRLDVSEVDQDGITAKLEDGVLTLVLPLKMEKAPVVRKIEID